MEKALVFNSEERVTKEQSPEHLPTIDTGLAKGFEYLFDFCSFLGHSREHFTTKIEAILRLVKEPKHRFSLDEFCTLFPEWTRDASQQFIRRLTDHKWLYYDDGYYYITTEAARFLRILPVLDSESTEAEEAALDIILLAAEAQDAAGARLEMHRLQRANAIRALKEVEEGMLLAMQSLSATKMNEQAAKSIRHHKKINTLMKYENEIYRRNGDKELHREAHETISRFQNVYGDFLLKYTPLLQDAIKSGGFRFTRREFNEYVLSSSQASLAQYAGSFSHGFPSIPQYLEEAVMVSAKQYADREAEKQPENKEPFVATELGEMPEFEADPLDEMCKRLTALLERRECHIVDLVKDEWGTTIFDLANIHTIYASKRNGKPLVGFDLVTSNEPITPSAGVVEQISDTVIRKLPEESR